MSYIKAHKSKNINRSLLVISSCLYNHLQLEKQCKLDDLFKAMKQQSNNQINTKDFMLSIHFLYVLGVIDYDFTKDNIILKNSEAI